MTTREDRRNAHNAGTKALTDIDIKEDDSAIERFEEAIDLLEGE